MKFSRFIYSSQKKWPNPYRVFSFQTVFICLFNGEFRFSIKNTDGYKVNCSFIRNHRFCLHIISSDSKNIALCQLFSHVYWSESAISASRTRKNTNDKKIDRLKEFYLRIGFFFKTNYCSECVWCCVWEMMFSWIKCERVTWVNIVSEKKWNVKTGETLGSMQHG